MEYAASSRVGSALLGAIDQSAKPQAAIVGMAKNAGKTIVTATLLRELACRQRVCAVVSSGRDGEEFDALDDRRKPKIPLGEGMAALVPRVKIGEYSPCEILHGPPLTGAAGELVLIRAQRPMDVELQGPRSARDMQNIVEYLSHSMGLLVVIDGAFDRVAASLTGDAALILATGAILDQRLATVVERTELRHAYLSLQQPKDGEKLRSITDVVDEQEAQKILAANDTQGLVLPTCLRMTLGAFAQLRRSKVIRTKKSFHLIACSTNAFAPAWAFDPTHFAQCVSEATHCMTVDCYRDLVISV